jgi:hypothetical protein
MRIGITRTYLRLAAALATTAIVLSAPLPASQAAPSPFDVLLGSWGGSGQITMTVGRKERLKCNAYYTGGGTQLGMAIRCQSESSNVEIRSKLSQSNGRITGTWEERTFNASGNAVGQASGDRISLQISGGVSGTMSVSYTSSRQSVSITTQNIALKSVSIDLTRS